MKSLTPLVLLVVVSLLGTKFAFDRFRPSGEKDSSRSPAQQNAENVVPRQEQAPVRDPKQIVTDLFEALKKGDRETVESLLSPVARREMPKYHLKVEPLGSPDGQYEITQVEYPKNKPGIAYVACIWKEPRPNGTIDAAEVVWVLQKQRDRQWAVTGMAVESPQGELVFFPFERPGEMIREWERLNQLYAQAEQQGGGAAAATARRPD